MLPLLLVIVIIALLLYWFLVAAKHPEGFPHGPRFTLPIFGDGLALGRDLYKGFDDLRLKYGDVYGLYLGPLRSVVVSDFDLIVEVGTNPAFQYRQDMIGSNGLKGDWVKSGDEMTIGGVISSQGVTWVEQRRYVLHKLRDLGFGKRTMENLISAEVQELSKEWEKSSGEPIDIRRDLNLAMVNSLWTIVTNERLEYDDAKMLKLVSMLDELFHEIASPVNFMLCMYPKALNFLETTKLLTGPVVARKMMALFDDIVSEHEATFQEDSLRDFTDHYLKEIKERSKSPGESSFKGKDGRTNLVNCLFDFFLAGSETTSTTLKWAMMYMILHPDIQSRVQRELDEVTGRSRLPCLADRESTPFTEAVLHELQRHINLVPYSVVHRASADAYLGGKYFIPKGTDLYSNIGLIMHDPEHFPNPSKFDPTRHLTKEGKFQQHPRILPFGVGRRRCLGETLARMSLYLFFTGVVSNFTLAKASEEDQINTEPTIGFTRAPHPFKMRFIPRK